MFLILEAEIKGLRLVCTYCYILVLCGMAKNILKEWNKIWLFIVIDNHCSIKAQRNQRNVYISLKKHCSLTLFPDYFFNNIWFCISLPEIVTMFSTCYLSMQKCDRPTAVAGNWQITKQEDWLRYKRQNKVQEGHLIWFTVRWWPLQPITVQFVATYIAAYSWQNHASFDSSFNV